MSTFDDLPVVGEAEWPRAGRAPIRIRLIASPRVFGTGDFEDPGDLVEDQPGEAFLIAWGAADEPGDAGNTIAGIASIDEARALVEGKFPGARWRNASDGA